MRLDDVGRPFAVALVLVVQLDRRVRGAVVVQERREVGADGGWRDLDALLLSTLRLGRQRATLHAHWDGISGRCRADAGAGIGCNGHNNALRMWSLRAMASPHGGSCTEDKPEASKGKLAGHSAQRGLGNISKQS